MISHRIILRMRNWKNYKCSFTFSEKNCCLWVNVGKYVTAAQATDNNIIQHRKDVTIQTHTLYLLHIALPGQQWLYKCTSMLCYLYITSLVLFSNCSIKSSGISYFLQYVILFYFHFALESVGGHIYDFPLYKVRIHASYIFCFCHYFGNEDIIYIYGVEVFSIVLYTEFNYVIWSQDVQECFCFSLLMGDAIATPSLDLE
jgi:hypothetical protein